MILVQNVVVFNYYLLLYSTIFFNIFILNRSILKFSFWSFTRLLLKRCNFNFICMGRIDLTFSENLNLLDFIANNTNNGINNACYLLSCYLFVPTIITKIVSITALFLIYYLLNNCQLLSILYQVKVMRQFQANSNKIVNNKSLEMYSDHNLL